MPQVRIERARVIGSPEVTLSPDEKSATIQCRGIIMAVNKRDGMKGGGDDRMTLTWVRQGDRWLLENYKSQKDWNGALRQVQKNSAAATQK